MYLCPSHLYFIELYRKWIFTQQTNDIVFIARDCIEEKDQEDYYVLEYLSDSFLILHGFMKTVLLTGIQFSFVLDQSRILARILLYSDN